MKKIYLFALAAACAWTACTTQQAGETTTAEAQQVGGADIAYVHAEQVVAECDLMKGEGAALAEKTQKAQESWAKKERSLQAPNRLNNDYERLDFLKFNQLNFEKPDIKKFRNLDFAFQAMKTGGNMPCILNAANEIAVYGFLNDKISFLGMSDLIEWAMENAEFISKPTYEDYVETDSMVRKITSEKIGI